MQEPTEARAVLGGVDGHEQVRALGMVLDVFEEEKLLERSRAVGDTLERLRCLGDVVLVNDRGHAPGALVQGRQPVRRNPAG